MKSYQINELEWDDNNIEHIWKHRVYVWEVHDVIADPDRKQFLHKHKKYGERLIVMGRTRGGRPVIVFLKLRDKDAGLWRCATAREADEGERRRYFS